MPWFHLVNHLGNHLVNHLGKAGTPRFHQVIPQVIPLVKLCFAQVVVRQGRIQSCPFTIGNDIINLKRRLELQLRPGNNSVMMILDLIGWGTNELESFKSVYVSDLDIYFVKGLCIFPTPCCWKTIFILESTSET